MEDCIFCNIASGKLNTAFLYEDDKVVAFTDLYPQAPIHALIIPREHFASIKEVEDTNLIGHLFQAGKEVAQRLALEDFRLVINTGQQAGQTVFHLHVHLLGGREMLWPPG
jgi:histidine triad (HIT) family protein